MKHLLTFLICIIITSCTKKGDPGETGPAGSNGTNGTNGNANVTAYHLTFTPQDWTTLGVAGINSYKIIKIPFAELDSNMIEKGSINVYSYENNYYQILPFDWSYFGNTTIHFNYLYSLDTLLIRANYSNSSGSAFPQNFYFKTVFIKGN